MSARDLNSCLYECTVFHRRIAPKQHEFLYRVFYFLIDLDELEQLERRLRLFTVNRPGLYSFRDSDHIGHGFQSVRENITYYLQQQGISDQLGHITLLTLPRIAGYVFNPISIYFCHDTRGNPLTSVAEVGNTFGEWKPYLVPLAQDGMFHARVVKHFYVSPFSDLDLEFDFRFSLPGERLSVAVDDFRGTERELISTLTGRRIPLTDATLLRFSAKYPLLTLQVIFGIHWQALRLWFKGLKVRLKEKDQELQLDTHRRFSTVRKSLAKRL